MKPLFRNLFVSLVSLFALKEPARASTPTSTNQRDLIVGITWAVTGEVPQEKAETIDRFETDLAIAVARTQGRHLVFRLGPLDQLLHELSAGRIDFMPGLARTSERQKSLDFSVPHSRLNTNLFVRRGDTSITSADNLVGKKIIVVRESYSHEWATQRGYAPQIILVADLKEGIQRLASGEGDCLLAKQINIFAAMQAAGVNNIEARGPPVADLIQDMCIAVRAGNRDLLAQLNEGLFQLKQTGELDRIYEKWLGLLEPSGVKRARLVRNLSLGGIFFSVIGALVWLAFRLQANRAQARLHEIEQRVTERTEELAAAKARYEAVVANTPASIVLIDPHDAKVPGRIVDCNESCCRVHDYPKAELIGNSINLLRFDPLTPEQLAAIVSELASGRRRQGESRHRRKDGSTLEVDFYSTLIRLDGRDLILAVDLDVTDRVRTETTLRRTEEFQRLVLQATNDGIFDWEIATDHFSLSTRGWQLLGFSKNELPGGRLAWWGRLHPDETVAAEVLLRLHLTESSPFIHTARYLHKNGSVRWLHCRADTLRDADGRPIRMVGSYADITDLKQKDEELQLTRRLRAVGELVGGIAHEFNNLLTPILLQTSQLASNASMNAETSSQLASVLDAARRAQTLTQQLLQFGRQENSESPPHSLAAVVDGTLSLVRSTVDRRIEIHANYEPSLALVRLNAVALGQVVMNLVINARDALLEKIESAPPDWRPQIDLQISTYTGPERGPVTPGRPPSSRLWQRLTVADNGPGIPPDILDRIFEPFFTTKVIGKGTGLGLAMVWRTIEDLGGWVEVKSTNDQGTQFHLYLPSTSEPVAIAAPVETTVAAPTAPITTSLSHRLMLVEDDELVGSVVAMMLRRLGQTVTWAHRGEEAWEILRNGSADYDGIFTDLNMPGFGGEALTVRLQAIGYQGKIVVLSGNITPDTAQRLRAAGIAALIQKPFEYERIKSLLLELWPNPPAS